MKDKAQKCKPWESRKGFARKSGNPSGQKPPFRNELGLRCLLERSSEPTHAHGNSPPTQRTKSL